MLYKNFKGNELLVIPNPDKPVHYLVFLALNHNYEGTLGNIASAIHDYIKTNNIDYDNIETVTVLSDVENLKKHYLAKTFSLYTEYKINPEEDEGLPFVPEFAHEKGRIEKIIEKKYDEIQPITCEIFPTVNCINRCRQCAYKTHKIAAGTWCANNFKDERWHMSPDIVENLVRKIKNAGVKYMVVTGGGDPLLNYKATLAIFKKAYELKNEGWDIKYGIYTNATVLAPSSHKEKNIVSLLEYEPEFIRISMNSATKDTYNEHHAPRNRNIDFIENIIKPNIINLLTDKNKRATRIGLSYLIDDVTVDDVGPFADWINGLYKEHNLEVDFIRFTPTIDYFSHSQYSQDFFDEARDKINKEAIPKIKETNTQVTLFNHRFSAINEKKSYEKCLGSGFFLEVGCDGSTYVCCETSLFPGYNTGNLAIHEYGNIQEHNYKEVIQRINDSKLISCPVFCKPHNINKILWELDKISNNSSIDSIKKWLYGLHEYWDWQIPAGSRFKKPQIVAF
jgi:adenine C2-methylase RlmN of 23S rRNA A2503 and tRNA A37